MARPATTEYASFYNNYINKTNVNSVQELIATYSNTLNNFFTAKVKIPRLLNFKTLIFLKCKNKHLFISILCSQ